MTKTERQGEWEARIAEYRASGQSAKAWCAAHNVTTRQLWYWLQKHKTKKNNPSAKATQWLPVKVSEQESIAQSNALVIKVGLASVEIRPGFDLALLSEILRILVAL